jgi:chromosome partitioning protein
LPRFNTFSESCPDAERQSHCHRRNDPERASGKTTLLRALISAAVAAGRRVLLIDTDSTDVLGTLHKRAEAAGLGSPLLRSETVESVGAVDRRIEQAYAADPADFIYIDTAGVGAEWSDGIAVLADHIMTPVMLSS